MILFAAISSPMYSSSMKDLITKIDTITCFPCFAFDFWLITVPVYHFTKECDRRHMWNTYAHPYWTPNIDATCLVGNHVSYVLSCLGIYAFNRWSLKHILRQEYYQEILHCVKTVQIFCMRVEHDFFLVTHSNKLLLKIRSVRPRILHWGTPLLSSICINPLYLLSPYNLLWSCALSKVWVTYLVQSHQPPSVASSRDVQNLCDFSTSC